jgi:hypothetical protein
MRIGPAGYRLHRVVRIGFVAQPSPVVDRRDDEWHSVMDVGDEFISVACDDRAKSLPRCRVFQFYQMPPRPNGLPFFIPIAKGCLAFWPLIAFHSKMLSTGTMRAARGKSREMSGGSAPSLGLGIDRFTAAFGVCLQYGISPSAKRDTCPVSWLRRMTSRSWAWWPVPAPRKIADAQLRRC